MIYPAEDKEFKELILKVLLEVLANQEVTVRELAEMGANTRGERAIKMTQARRNKLQEVLQELNKP